MFRLTVQSAASSVAVYTPLGNSQVGGQQKYPPKDSHLKNVSWLKTTTTNHDRFNHGEKTCPFCFIRRFFQLSLLPNQNKQSRAEVVRFIYIFEKFQSYGLVLHFVRFCAKARRFHVFQRVFPVTVEGSRCETVK